MLYGVASGCRNVIAGCEKLYVLNIIVSHNGVPGRGMTQSSGNSGTLTLV